jgi:hypothetical protein
MCTQALLSSRSQLPTHTHASYTVGELALSFPTTTSDRHMCPGGMLYILSGTAVAAAQQTAMLATCISGGSAMPRIARQLTLGLSVQRKQLSNIHLLTQVLRYQSVLRIASGSWPQHASAGHKSSLGTLIKALTAHRTVQIA